jgi:hypothetical protein
MVGWLVTKEFGRISKEVVMASFEVLSRHLPRETKITTNLRQMSLSPGRDLNPGPPEHNGVLHT